MLVCAFGKGSSSKSPTFTTFCKANFHFIYVLDFRFNEDVIGNTVVAARVALMEIRGSREGEASRRVKKLIGTIARREGPRQRPGECLLVGLAQSYVACLRSVIGLDGWSNHQRHLPFSDPRDFNGFHQYQSRI